MTVNIGEGEDFHFLSTIAVAKLTNADSSLLCVSDAEPLKCSVSSGSVHSANHAALYLLRYTFVVSFSRIRHAANTSVGVSLCFERMKYCSIM